jgi:hypothetical protein
MEPTLEQIAAIQPRLVETAYGKWLALAEPGSVLHIGVMGDSEQDARQHFVEARTKWQAIFQPNQEEAVGVG